MYQMILLVVTVFDGGVVNNFDFLLLYVSIVFKIPGMNT